MLSNLQNVLHNLGIRTACTLIVTTNCSSFFSITSSADIFLALQIAAFVIFGIGAFLVWQVGGYRKRGYQMTGYWLVCIGYGGSFLAFIYIEKLLAVSHHVILVERPDH